MKPTSRTSRKSKSRGTHRLKYNKRNKAERQAWKDEEND